MGLFALMVLIGVVIIVWIYQFTFLMALEDNMFSGRYDKVLWCAAFILVPALTPFAFLVWRKVKRGESK